MKSAPSLSLLEATDLSILDGNYNLSLDAYLLPPLEPTGLKDLCTYCRPSLLTCSLLLARSLFNDLVDFLVFVLGCLDRRVWCSTGTLSSIGNKSSAKISCTVTFYVIGRSGFAGLNFLLKLPDFNYYYFYTFLFPITLADFGLSRTTFFGKVVRCWVIDKII